jgi:hypothetical protein
MLVIGGILCITFVIWEAKYATHPVMPLRVLNKTFVMCCIIDFMYYFSYYMTGTYYASWVYVVKDWSVSAFLRESI